MFTSQTERAAVLDRQLEEVGEELRTRHKLPEYLPVNQPSQELAFVCGRICCEASEGKLNATSVVLEGTRQGSAGFRVNLDLSQVPQWALFPGQIVAVEGVNSSGRKLVARRIFSDTSAPSAQTMPSKLQLYNHSAQYLGGEPLTVLAAAGPFTTAHDMEYEPFSDFLNVIAKIRPDVVTLVGPFVDANHPKVASGSSTVKFEGRDMEMSFEDMFQFKIKTEIEKALRAMHAKDGLRTRVVIVPSLDDVQHDFVYPQPPFNYNFDDAVSDDVILLSNPATFSLNEVTFGVTSSDILFHMGSDEIAKTAGQTAPRIVRLAEHCLEQHSYYPLFPARAGVAQLDLRHQQKYQLPRTPDVMIVPSKFQFFADRVFCIAPSYIPHVVLIGIVFFLADQAQLRVPESRAAGKRWQRWHLRKTHYPPTGQESLQ